MHPLTQAIEVFEQEAVRIKLNYRANLYITCEAGCWQDIYDRDEGIEKCLWAVGLLQEAYIKSLPVSCPPKPLEAIPGFNYI